jgi:hypothetical protein
MKHPTKWTVMFHNILSLLLFIAPTANLAAQKPTSLEGLFILVDQDFFTAENEDRNYTMGVAIGLLGPGTAFIGD